MLREPSEQLQRQICNPIVVAPISFNGGGEETVLDTNENGSDYYVTFDLIDEDKEDFFPLRRTSTPLPRVVVEKRTLASETVESPAAILNQLGFGKNLDSEDLNLVETVSTPGDNYHSYVALRSDPFFDQEVSIKRRKLFA